MIALLEFNLLENNGSFLIHDTERKNIQNSIRSLLTLFKKKFNVFEIEYLITQKEKRITIIHKK